ncbi:hypothetical protein ANO11243_077930 [Dothideomycetidae sp. 11243]|nr:hypothetical protein ANO11243_077930 [fungal sp. No.11243]
MAACRAIHATAVRNIDFMSPDQRELVVIAQEALRKHMHTILQNPSYLEGLRWAMDFVWAKVAFSFLLLLKLSIILHISDAEGQSLVEQGRALEDGLGKAVGYGSSRIYLRLLHISLNAYVCRDQGGASELETLVPEEFVNEWNFPGLDLFSSPNRWDLLFDQYLLGENFFVGLDV